MPKRWSTGMLYDNCRVPGGGIEFRNRGSMGLAPLAERLGPQAVKNIGY